MALSHGETQRAWLLAMVNNQRGQPVNKSSAGQPAKHERATWQQFQKTRNGERESLLPAFQQTWVMLRDCVFCFSFLWVCVCVSAGVGVSLAGEDQHMEQDQHLAQHMMYGHGMGKAGRGRDYGSGEQARESLADNLSAWLPTTSLYDIIAIGAQECDYPARAPHAECSKDWMATLRSVLGPDYKVVHGITRGQMRLAVFVRTDVEKAISDVDSGSEATGVGNVIPNKGGVCIALKFWDTFLCFVNCHLAAHEGQCEARNGNYREIVGNMRINDQHIDILNQFHYVFWFGDLNYRLDFGAAEEGLTSPETTIGDAVAQKIQQNEFDTLLEFDELHKEQEAKRVLFSFKEGEITFPPTFKMKKDTEDVYDTKRVPAWCDRVLWSSFPGCNVDQLSYTSAPSVLSSDHKPVAATFALTAYALPCNYVENLDEDDKRWHIRFTVLRARNLRASDMSGYSDPYVSFVGSNLYEEAQTAVRLQNLNPVWNPLKDLPTIVLNTFALERLEKEYLMVRVVDYDKKSADDTLGCGVIPLAGAVAAFKKKGTSDFVVELSHRGCPAGTLEGTIKLTWERNVVKRRFKLGNTFAGRSMSMKQQLKSRMLSNRMLSNRIF